MKYEFLEKNIKYKFNDANILKHALTHSSFANEKHDDVACNERLEFLGDAVLSFVSAEYLYNLYPNMPEGDLSKLRSSLVCTQSLSDFARQIDLGMYLLLGNGERKNGGQDRPSTLEDAFEALIAAIYLDGGIEPAKKFILSFLSVAIKTHHISYKDYKSALQEVIQQNPDQALNYIIVGESGPDHQKTFEVEVHLNSNVIGKGKGPTKKKAEQEAAKEALSLMGI